MEDYIGFDKFPKLSLRPFPNVSFAGITRIKAIKDTIPKLI